MERRDLTFRVFVSSTFSDLVAERNALQEHVFPRLGEFCQKHGARFQAIDLRWGVSEKAGQDQSTIRICRAEIARCQTVTPRPNFVALLGDRHGWRPLPDEIPSAEFEALLPRLPADLAKRWYKLDENAVCPLPGGAGLDKGKYILQPRTGNFEDQDRWAAEVEVPLGDGLRRAARELGLPEKDRLKYEASATAQEIHDGAFAKPESSEHVVAFIREIHTADGRLLREALPHDAALKNFVDLKKNTHELDHESQAQLNTLKQQLRERLGLERVKAYPARWEGNGASTDHISRLCVDVYRSLRRLIHAQIKHHTALSPLADEKRHHQEFARRRARDFTGRAEALAEIARYLSPTSESVAPLVVHGASGSGKSALVAKTVADHQSRHAHHQLVFRYIGATANSTDLRSLLEGLCRELGERYGADNTDLPLDLNKLVAVFLQRLELPTAEHPLALFLDALDQLQVADRPELFWLPDKLPACVRLVISVIPGPSLDSLRSRLPSAHLLELGPMRPEDGAELLQKWLQRTDRRLVPEDQRRSIQDAIARCSLPLYLRLAFEEAQRWRSYDDPPPLRPEVDGLIERLFHHLSAQLHHEPLLVERTISYLRCSRYGLSESEILDLLARDKEYWEKFQASSCHTLPIIDGQQARRLPIVIWSRLYHDLEPYLSWRSADGVVLIVFFHTRFNEVADRQFLRDDAVRRGRHDALSRYFRAEGDPRNAHVWQQNARPLGELPFHLAHGTGEKELRELFSQLGFLAARVATGRIYEQITDYHLTGSTLPAELSPWHDFLQKHAQRLKRHPATLVALVNHEGFAAARAQVPTVSWPQPWLQTSPEPMPSSSVSETEGIRPEVLGSVEFGYGRASALASKRMLVFSLERIGAVRVVDAAVMRESHARLSIRRQRPLLFQCAPDATSLAVLFDTGQGDLYRCIFGADDRPSSLELVVTFDFYLPDYEDPAVAWHEGEFWFQTRADALACIDSESGHLREERLPAGAHGELAALVFTGSARLIALRQEADALLLGAGETSVRRPVADAVSACACGPDSVAVAFTDGMLVIYDLTSGLTQRAEVHVGMIRGALGWDGEKLLWLEEYECSLRAWWPPAKAPMQIYDNEEVVRKTLHVSPRQWHAAADGTILLLTMHGVAAFRLRQGGAAPLGRLDALWGGWTWRALWRRENDHWLMEGAPSRALSVNRGALGRLCCAPDGRGHFFSVDAEGNGRMVTLATLQSTAMRGCPPLPNIAAGDPEGGCWFTDREAHIYFCDVNGKCQRVTAVGLPEPTGARLDSCGEYLVWTGLTSHWFPETGMEPARTLVFFRRSITPAPKLERLGNQILHPREGMCKAVLYNVARDQLVTLWLVEGRRGFRLRLGSVQDFIAWKIVERDLIAPPVLDCLQAALSIDGRCLALLSSGGEVRCFNVDDGRSIAELDGSTPFIGLASAAGEGEFWLVEATGNVHGCKLRQPI